MNNKKYKSAGAALTKQDFKAFIDYLKEAEMSGDMKDFQLMPDGLPSELDKLLFALPNYILKKNEEDEKTTELCEYGKEAIDTLLYYGADPNANFKNSITPFMKACEVNNAVLIKKLIDNPIKPANIALADGQGNRPFFYATMAEATNVMDHLAKDCQVNINFQYILSQQQTVFHYACGHAKEKSIDKLIELGANPCMRDNYENLPAELIPTYDEDIHEEGEISDEDIELWDKLFEKMQVYTKTFEQKNISTKKKVF